MKMLKGYGATLTIGGKTIPIKEWAEISVSPTPVSLFASGIPESAEVTISITFCPWCGNPQGHATSEGYAFCALTRP